MIHLRVRCLADKDSNVSQLLTAMVLLGSLLKPATAVLSRQDLFVNMLRRGTHGSSLRTVIHWTEELKQILAAGGAR